MPLYNNIDSVCKDIILQELDPAQVVHLTNALREVKLIGFGEVIITIVDGEARFVSKRTSERFGAESELGKLDKE